MFPNVQPRNANKFLNKTLVEGTDQEAIDEETGEWYIVTTPATRKIGERMAKMNNTKQFHINIIKIRYAYIAFFLKLIDNKIIIK